MFDELMNDVVHIQKSDGTRLGPYRTALSSDSATIFDGRLDVVEGDHVIRKLPSGREESYLITLAEYTEQFEDFPAGYNLQLRKLTAIPQASAPRATTINIHHSTGIQVGDYNSINIQNALNELVQKIESADASPEEKTDAKGRLAAFLAHPLVIAVVGGIAGSIASG